MSRLQSLPASKQDAIAAIILAEIEDDERWDESLARSPDVLTQLATAAMAEYCTGET